MSMVVLFEVRSNRAFCKCSSCGESIRHSELMVRAEKSNAHGVFRPIAGEHYCPGCEACAHANNPEADGAVIGIEYFDGTAWTVAELFESDNESKTERMREVYASYENKNAFWDDMEAGLI